MASLFRAAILFLTGVVTLGVEMGIIGQKPADLE
jgi:hypothetical protein